MPNKLPTKPCPDCGVELTPRAGSCKCGWELSPSGKKGQRADLDQLRNRCSWAIGGDRCRFVGSLGHGSPGGPGQRYPDLFCIRHFNCEDQAFGAMVVEESLRVVPLDFDYLSEAIAARTRESFKKTPLDEACGETQPQRPFVAAGNLSAHLKLAAPRRRRGDDPDAIAERVALQASDA